MTSVLSYIVILLDIQLQLLQYNFSHYLLVTKEFLLTVCMEIISGQVNNVA